MRSVLKWSLRLVGLLVLVVAVLALLNRDRIERLVRVNTLFEADRIVANFSAMDTMFETAALHRGEGPVTPLETAPRALPETFEHDGATIRVEDWLAQRSTTGFVVLHDGALVHEAYFQGTTADDPRISWSVAKSFLSVLLGTVVEEGAIGSLDDPVERYAPELAGSAYEGVRIRDVLHMASGVRFDENYFDYNSDINRMGRVLALGRSMDAFAAGLTERDRPAGEAFQYVSIDTHVIGMVIRGATGRSIPDLMAERVIEPLGVEHNPYYITDGYDTAFVLGGLNLTTRDYARFGLMVANGGEIDGRRIVSEGWIVESTAPSDLRPATATQIGYGYQWWIPPNATPGETYATGIYGQYLYVDPAAGVVIVVNSADPGFQGARVEEGYIALFRAIADGIAG